MQLNWFDRAIAVVAPRAALRRGQARAALGRQTDAGGAKRAYDGASVSRRTDQWIAASTSANAEIALGLVRMRNRSRDLHRNNPHARKARTAWVNNLVGTGIVPRARTGNAVTDKAVNALWDEWSRVADSDGQLDFGGLEELMVTAMVEGGEALVRRRLRLPSDNLPVPLQLQVMEGDLLDENRTGAAFTGAAFTSKIINGVEFDALGRRQAYWLYPNHPGDSMILPVGNLGLLSVPVPASEVIHLYRKERTQARGIPWCHSIIMRARDLDDYEDAELVRKKTEACVVGIVTGADADEGAAPTSDGTNLTVKDSEGRPVERFEPGLLLYSYGGKQISFNNPTQSGSYPDIQRLGLHSIAAGYLVPYELMTGDLSQVNFSSARVGLVEFRRLVETVQWLCLIPMALQPIWDWFCQAGYLVGKLPAASIPVEWDTPAWETVNPIDDANAELIQLRSGTRTLYEAIARRTGRNPQEVLREIAEGNALLDELGLIFDSDPRRVSRAGTEQASAGANPAPPAPSGGRGNLREVA